MKNECEVPASHMFWYESRSDFYPKWGCHFQISSWVPAATMERLQRLRSLRSRARFRLDKQTKQGGFQKVVNSSKMIIKLNVLLYINQRNGCKEEDYHPKNP